MQISIILLMHEPLKVDFLSIRQLELFYLQKQVLIAVFVISVTASIFWTTLDLWSFWTEENLISTSCILYPSRNILFFIPTLLLCGVKQCWNAVVTAGLGILCMYSGNSHSEQGTMGIRRYSPRWRSCSLTICVTKSLPFTAQI